MKNKFEIRAWTLMQVQGIVFKKSSDLNINSKNFIETFLLSDVSTDIDNPYDHLQWAGEAYIMERFLDEQKDKIIYGGEIFPKDELYWIGYFYRFWHYYTEQSSHEVFKEIDVETMRKIYREYSFSDYEYEDIIEEVRKDINSPH